MKAKTTTQKTETGPSAIVSYDVIAHSLQTYLESRRIAKSALAAAKSMFEKLQKRDGKTIALARVKDAIKKSGIARQRESELLRGLGVVQRKSGKKGDRRQSNVDMNDVIQLLNLAIELAAGDGKLASATLYKAYTKQIAINKAKKTSK